MERGDHVIFPPGAHAVKPFFDARKSVRIPERVRKQAARVGGSLDYDRPLIVVTVLECIPHARAEVDTQHNEPDACEHDDDDG